NFNLCEIGQSRLHIPALECVADNLQNVRLRNVTSDGLTGHHQHIVVLGGNDRHAYVHVWQKPEVLIIYDTGRFPNIARTAKLDGRWDGRYGGLPNASGSGIPGDFNRVAGSQPGNVGLVHESAHQHFSKVRDLQQKIAVGDEASWFDGQRVDDAIKWGAHVRFRQRILRGVVSSLRFIPLGLNT